MSNNVPSDSLPPLFVDLDGTLVKSDLLVESFLDVIKRNPLVIFHTPFWFLRGKAYFKQKIAERAHVDSKLLPYNKSFVSFLKSEAVKGRQLILASASHETLARQVADHFGFFQKVLASDGKLNLTGERKLEEILKVSQEGEFDYAGNAPIDLRIWSHCRTAFLVNPSRGLEKALRRKGKPLEVFEERNVGLSSYLRVIRVHHWLKNVLLFVPLITSHKWNEVYFLFNLIAGFLSFSFVASSGYLFNDFLDLESDRNHPRKCKRPLARGDIRLTVAGTIMISLLLAGFAIGIYLSIKFAFILFLYIIFSQAYSMRFKSVVLVDVLILALLYTIRVIAGAILVDVYLSFWLLAFSMFIFLSLALVKRCSELTKLVRMKNASAKGRDYHVSDLEYLHNMGTTSGYLSVLVLALYINSNEVLIHYTNPKFLWILCPTILYWVSRLWLKTGRGEMDDDPLIFTIKDWASWLAWMFCAASIILAI
jgi:4-hydroxybenzoate polyprenyltransferase